MLGLESIFDGWTTQVHGWPTDYSKGLCVWEFLSTKVPAHRRLYIERLAVYIAKKMAFPVNVAFKSDRSLIEVHKKFPENVFIYANDILRLTIEDFKTLDLEFQFQLEEESGVTV